MIRLLAFSQLFPAKAGIKPPVCRRAGGSPRAAARAPAFAGMAGALFIAISTPAIAQPADNPIPSSGGALIMPKDILPDPLAAGWKGEKTCAVLQETKKFRALRCAFGPGAGHERHHHAAHFGFVLQGGKMRITDKTGTIERELKSGASWESDGVEWHEAVNVGDTTAIYLIVEPKGPVK